MVPQKNPRVDKRFAIAFLAGFAIAVAVICALVYYQRDSVSGIIELVQKDLPAHLQATSPALFLAAFILLPMAGFPITPFYLLCGAYGHTQGILIAFAGTLVNMSLSYWLASGILRPLVGKLLQRRNIRVPIVSPHNYKKLTILVRAFPGFPYALQNYFLAVAKIPFLTYLWISWLIQAAYALAFIFFGKAFFEGQTGTAVIALSLLVCLIIITRMVHRKYASAAGKIYDDERAGTDSDSN